MRMAQFGAFCSIITDATTNIPECEIVDKDRLESRLQSLLGSLRIEGITLDDEHIDKVRAVMSGELDGDAEIKRLLAPYKEAEALKKTGTK